MMTFIVALSLCSFSSSGKIDNGNEDEFIENIEELKPNLDKEFIYREDDLDIENKLSDEDIEEIKEFVSYDETRFFRCLPHLLKCRNNVTILFFWTSTF